MKSNLNKIDQYISLKDNLLITAKIFCAILLVTFIKYQGISLFIRSSATILLLGGLILPKLVKHPLFWLVIASFNLIHLVENYFSSANHQFLFVYYSFIFSLAFTNEEEQAEEFLIKSFKYMFIVVMGLATLHKAFSLFYWQGGLIYDYILRGGILKYFVTMIDSNNSAITVLNAQKLEAFIGNYASIGQGIKLQEPLPWLSSLSSILSASVILIEATLTIMIASNRFQRIKHWLYLSFVISTFFFRMENLFLSTIALTGFVLCPKENETIRSTYFIIILYFLSLSVLSLMPGFYY